MSKKFLKYLLEMYDNPKGWDRFYFNIKYRPGSMFDDVSTIIPKKSKIIDVGCGIGILANILAYNSNERIIYGIDLDERRIKKAKKTIKNRNNLKFEVANISNVSLDYADVIIIYDVLHHLNIKNQIRILVEAKKKLNKDGLLIIKDIDKSNWKWIISFLLDSFSDISNITMSDRLNFLNGEVIMNYLKKLNFQFEKQNINVKDFCSHILLVCKKL